jgi:hypothetical protein
METFTLFVLLAANICGPIPPTWQSHACGAHPALNLSAWLFFATFAIHRSLPRASYAAAIPGHSASLELWLRGGLEIGGRRQRVTPGDIAVLYPRRRPDAVLHSRSSSYVEELYRALGTVPP